MIRTRAVLILSAILLACLSACPVSAKMAMESQYDMIAQSTLVVRGTVEQVGEKSARVKVSAVLKGSLHGTSITVSPVTVSGCVGTFPNFRAGEEVILMLQGANSPFTIVAFGAGKLSLAPSPRKAGDVAAITRLIAIAGLKDDDARTQAMLAEATSKYPLLKSEALSYIRIRLAGSKERMRYKDTLLNLLKNPDDQICATALYVMENSRDPQALPLIIAASQRSSAYVVTTACDALLRYETPAAANALIAVAKNPDPVIRGKAALNLGRCQQPGAFEAASALLNDPDANVRGLAVRGLIDKFRAHKADALIPRLLVMLDAPGAESQEAAAHALGECARVDGIKPLLAVLDRPEISQSMEFAVVSALSALCHLNRETPSVIKPEVGKIIRVLEHGSPGAAFQTVGILCAVRTPEGMAALKRAATGHRDAEVRDYAKRTLAWIMKGN